MSNFELIKNSKTTMKKYFFLLVLSFFALSTSFYGNTQLRETIERIEPLTQTVYITKTGKKYHAGGCRYLSKSKIEIAKSKAVKAGYDACKVCAPL